MKAVGVLMVDSQNVCARVQYGVLGAIDLVGDKSVADIKPTSKKMWRGEK